MDFQQYLDEKIHQLRIVCQTQWDYLRYAEACEWMDANFSNDIEGKYYATKILLHTVYYSKTDMEKLLRYGIFEKIYGTLIKNDLLKSQNIYIPNSEAIALVNAKKNKTFFVPLSDSGKPQESGNLIISDLVHKLDFSALQVDYAQNVTEEKLKDFEILVFVDDCIGSGNQLRKFWNSPSVQIIKDICNKKGILMYFLVLVGYKDNVEKLVYEGEVTGVRIVTCDLLTNKNRVFSDNSIIWENGEREAALAFFEKLKRQKGVNFTGYRNLDFAIILHDRLPDWSLPIFWKQSPEWKCLLRRKNSTQ